MKKRTDKLAAMLPEGFGAALVTTEPNRFYLLGFDSADAGTVLVLANEAYYIIDSRYIEIAREQVKEVEVVLEDRALEQVADILRAKGVQTLYMENKATIAYAESVKETLEGVTVITDATLSNALEAMRKIKDETEIACMRKAQEITDACYHYILPFLKPGAREIDIALEMEQFMRKNGAGKLAFDTILVSGKNTSLPHGVPSEKCIEDGDFVTMDFGANYGGYCTDMTRTVAVGHVSDEQRDVYETVLKAQLAACEAAKAGLTGVEVDKVARDIIDASPYKGAFTHGLGHSVGIEIHERPSYSMRCNDVVEEGTMMTIEPGIYLAGKFGVRIEDTVIVRENGIEILGNCDKNLVIV